MTDQKRDYRIYYVACPEESSHFILKDPASHLWEKTPPKSPLMTECRGCGPHYRVTVTQPWKTGYISSLERDQLIAYSEPFLQAEHISAKSALVTLLRNGEPRVCKKDLKAQSKYGYSKEFLLEFSEKNPLVFKNYKGLLPKKLERLETDFVIESRQREPRQVASDDLVHDLEQIPPGREHATQYHDFIKGVLTEVFAPSLTRPKKEQEIDEGRKRIDISFHNSATEGFFSKLVSQHKYVVPYVPIECKNYTDDIANPEFDQMLGRLNRRRGMFGIIVCRTIVDNDAVLKRCQDAVKNDPEKAILVLDDTDVKKLLDLQANGNKKGISEHLEDKLREVLD